MRAGVMALTRKVTNITAMKATLLPAFAALCLFSTPAARAEPVEARLEALAIIQAGESLAPPSNAPAYFNTTGRFTGEGNSRVAELGAVAGAGGVAALPMAGQALQGISAILAQPNGSILALTDNGFGSRANSADAMLMIHRLVPDWQTGTVVREQTIFLSDPQAIAPFPIVTETTRTRFLTGRDFDPESFAPRAGGGFWVGDEFGPYLLEFDARGRLLSITPVVAGGGEVRSPDHWRGEAARVGRSRGLEGMAHSADGRFLYPMLEAPLLDGTTPETQAGVPVSRILEFDTTARTFTGREWLYPFSDASHAAGDITLIGDGQALVLERDSRQGAEARFKRIVRIDLPTEGGLVRVGPSVDLLAIADPQGRARGRGADGRFTFPFTTIESIAALEGGRLLIINDNNYPFSAGRNPTRPDDTEMIILSAPGLFSPVQP